MWLINFFIINKIANFLYRYLIEKTPKFMLFICVEPTNYFIYLIVFLTHYFDLMKRLLKSYCCRLVTLEDHTDKWIDKKQNKRRVVCSSYIICLSLTNMYNVYQSFPTKLLIWKFHFKLLHKIKRENFIIYPTLQSK